MPARVTEQAQASRQRHHRTARELVRRRDTDQSRRFLRHAIQAHTVGVTDKTVRAFQGILLFLVLACDTLIRYQIRFVPNLRRAAERAPTVATEAAHGNG